MHLVVINVWHLNVCIIDQQDSSFGIVLEVQRVETFGSRLEFVNALLRMDLEDTITISAVIGHPEFASQAVERKGIGNSTRVEIHRCVAKIGLRRGGHSATVAMDLNGVLVGRMFWTCAGLVNKSTVDWLLRRTRSELMVDLGTSCLNT